MKIPNPFERQYAVRAGSAYLGPTAGSRCATPEKAWSATDRDVLTRLAEERNIETAGHLPLWSVEHIEGTGAVEAPLDLVTVRLELRPDQLLLAIRNCVMSVQRNIEPGREIHERETFELIRALRLAMGLKTEEVPRQAA